MAIHTGRFAFVAIFLALCGCGTKEQRPDATTAAPPSSMQGAWRLAELRIGGGTPVTNPPSVFLFADGHYSILYVNTAEANRSVAKPDSVANAEKVRIYDTFIANAGTYIVAGDTLVIRPLVSKHPNYMGGGEDRFITRHAGDTLWLTEVPGSFRWANGQPSRANATPDAFILLRAP